MLPPTYGPAVAKYINTVKIKSQKHHPCGSPPRGRITLRDSAYQESWIYHPEIWCICVNSQIQTGKYREYETG